MRHKYFIMLLLLLRLPQRLRLPGWLAGSLAGYVFWICDYDGDSINMKYCAEKRYMLYGVNVERRPNGEKKIENKLERECVRGDTQIGAIESRQQHRSRPNCRHRRRRRHRRHQKMYIILLDTSIVILVSTSLILISTRTEHFPA